MRSISIVFLYAANCAMSRQDLSFNAINAGRMTCHDTSTMRRCTARCTALQQAIAGSIQPNNKTFCTSSFSHLAVLQHVEAVGGGALRVQVVPWRRRHRSEHCRNLQK